MDSIKIEEVVSPEEAIIDNSEEIEIINDCKKDEIEKE